jgi:hypothetical protein
MRRITIITLFMLSLVRVSAQDVIEIVYNGSTATVNSNGISDIVQTVNGANVTITSKTTNKEYTYKVKGASTDGSLTINGDYKLTLQLAGVTLVNNHGGAAIDVECGKRIAVELADGTVNTLTDAANGEQKAALYFKGHVEFKGSGTLNVTGKTKHAISAKEYIELKSTTGTINVMGAVSDGIHCGKGKVNNENNYFRMKGGIVNIINVGGDGVDSDDYGVIQIEGGAISLNISDDATGLKADSTVTIKDGLVNISVNGDDSKGIRANHTINILGGKTTIIVEGDGSKGIKAKCDEDNVLNGGYLNISGGELSIQCIGGNLTTGTETTKCVAISVDADLKQTAGDVNITVLGAEALGCTVDGNKTHTGGTFNIRQVPWQIKTKDYQYDMTVYATVSVDDVVLTDYSDITVGAFIGDECVGYGIFEEKGYGVIRIRNNDNSAQPVTFKVYYFSSQMQYDLTPSQTVTFQKDTNIGEPSTPIVLSYNMKLEGDANSDGEVNVADVDYVIEAIGEDGETHKDADVNGDGEINVADVDYIIERIV